MTAARERLLSVLTEPVTITNARQVDGPGLRYSYCGALADPGAVLDRLLAVLTDDETVETFARYIFEKTDEWRWLASSDVADFDEYVEKNQDEWRDAARAALSALTGTGDGQ